MWVPALRRASLLGCVVWVASSANLDCTHEASSALAVCCDAETAWSSMESAGGCGGKGATSEQCSAASSLCRQCRMAISAHATVESESGAAEGALLSSLDVSFLEVHCVLPQWQDSCHSSVADLGFGVLLLAGGVLMLLATGALVLFDWRALPWMVSRAAERYQQPQQCSSLSADKLGQWDARHAALSPELSLCFS